MRLTGLALALVLLASCAAAPLAGTDLGKRAAADFTLLDGVSGEATTLSSLRGTVVVLTFLYTRCPDICPLTAAKLRIAKERLGADAEHVSFVAVSVDPVGDTPAAAQRFVDAHGMRGSLRYLIGDGPSLATVWQRYGIAAIPEEEDLVGHTDAIFLIDRQGRERALLRTDFDIDLLVRDLRTLIGESRFF